MRHFLSFSVILAIWVPASVHGAKCSDLTSAKCEVTDFTLATCDSSTKICSCKDGYVAIKSGCAKKIAKPMVTVPLGRTKEIITGKDGILSCTAASTLSGLTGVTYEWKKDSNTLSGETGSSYTISSAAAATVGAFSCKVKYTHPDGTNMDSEESDAVTIALIDDGTAGAKSATQPVLGNLPAKAAADKTLSPSCTDIPMGATFKFVYEDDSDAASPLIFNTAAQAKSKLKCVMDNPEYFDNIDSELVDMPTLATTIDGAVVTVYAVGSDYTYKTGGTGPLITCTSDPEEAYLGDVTYAFVDSAVASPTVTANTYTPSSTAAAVHVISCSATFDGKAVTAEPTVTVTFNDDHITTPVLVASGTSLVEGSRLVLTCGDAQDDVMFSWTKDAGSGAKAIERQFDRIIQIDNFQSTDEATYECKATKNNYVATSNGIAVMQASTIATAVQKTHDGTTFGADGDYTLLCYTTAATVGMAYTWKRDTTDLKTTTSTYSIKDASAAKDNGTYTCTASFNSVYSAPNTGLTVSVVAAGKECAADSDCTGLGDGYKGTCGTTDPKRCECATDYEQKGDVCSKSHGTVFVGSALLVVAAAILSRLF